ncbi:hypothetical protein Adt_47696 [Abeliophyllum distichum]|uniref:Uncharacterized protein n=1 Tax=Abeliophyllum distichum TaxID=126358 RepID=A0ABD1NT57_9LAMI
MKEKRLPPLTKRPKVVDLPKPTLSKLVRGGRVGEASKNNKKKRKETLPEVSLGAQAFSRYLLLSWKAFMTEEDMEDLFEASIACSIRAASTWMRSLNAVKEYNKMAGEAAKAAEFRTAMDGLTVKTESAKAAITATALEKANEEKNTLQLSTQSEVVLLKADLEATANARLDSEDAYVRILAEKKVLEEKLKNAEAEFTVNFHNTEAYASFSSFFASVEQQKVLTAL